MKKQEVTSKPASKAEVEKFVLGDDVELQDKKEKTTFGWMWCRPSCIQVINNPIGYCGMLCLLTVCQSMTSFGLVYVNLTTLEKRFAFSSVQSSWISSSYDFCNLVVAVFVSYFGEKGHRPLWVGISSIVFAIGSMIFTLPHFISPNYVYHETNADYCGLPNQTSTCDDITHESIDAHASVYTWFFVIGQILHGVGSASLYTLGVAYIDENVPTRHFGLYMGFYQGICVIGPSLGYALGGVFLSIYGDLNVDGDDITIDENSPLWVGAWWIGFIMNGSLLFIFSLMYMGFPKSLPGGSKIMMERQFEAQKGSEFMVKDGAINQTKDLPRAVWKLVTNLPFMFMSMTVVVQFFMLAALAVFGPKYIESQLSMTPTEAAYIMGILSVTGGLTGAIIGGILVNRLDLKFAGLMKLCATCAFLSMSTCFVFTAVCPTVDFAGVTVAYENMSMPHVGPAILNATCNSRCSCSSSYDPVCGSDGIMYFSACHAGCDVDTDNHNGSFIECSCVIDTTSASGLGSAVSGTCDSSCPYTGLYFAALFLILLFGATTGVSTWTATVRVVSHSQRAFALGFQTLMYGLLGCVPGPILLGALLDQSCLLWETSCEGDTGNCWLYENRDSALWFLILCVSCQFLAVVFFLLALISYRPTDKVVPTKDQDASEETSSDLLQDHKNALA